MNKQVKAGISAVRDFLAGRSGDAKVADPEDKATREVVAAELLATMSGRAEMHSKQGEETTEAEDSAAEKERARQLFVDHGYFDEAVQDLRAGDSAERRAAAAQALGLVGSQRGTAHLIAAMFDEDDAVRTAAEEALARIGDPTVSKQSSQTPIAAAEAKASRSDDSEQSKQAKDSEQVALQSVTPAEEPSTSTSHSSTHKEASGGKPVLRDKSGRFVPVREGVTPAGPVKTGPGERPGRPTKPSQAEAENEEMETRAAAAPQTGAVDVADAATDPEEAQLLLEENAVRETVEQLEAQLLEVTKVLKESENQIHWRIERESKLRTDAAARHREEEQARKQADEEAERRRLEEREAIAAEQSGRLQAETESQSFAQEEARLRTEATRLRMAVEELARHRSEMETARHEIAVATRQAEATRLREEADKRHQEELERLRSEEDAMRTAAEEAALRRSAVEAAREEAELEIARLTEERAQLEIAQEARRVEAERIHREEERNRADQEQLALQAEALQQVAKEISDRRAEVEAAREKADKDAERLLETQARMKAAEEARDKAEIERRHVEEEINQRVEAEMRLLAEARHRAQAEQVRLEEEARRQAEAEKLRLAELEAALERAEAESKHRNEQQQQVLGQLDSLRIADAEARKRIEDAEVKRRASEEAYRLAAEKLQRVEAEAHAAAAEEERMLLKLESERRNVANEAQARAEQEKRIREEIEMFRRLEEEERPRIEEAVLQRAAAEALLQQGRERINVEDEIRVRAEDQLAVAGQYVPAMSPAEEPAREETFAAGVSAYAPVEEAETAELLLDEDIPEDIPALPPAPSPTTSGSNVPPAIALYLNSVDPYKRAAAVAELARSRPKDAYSIIVDCFDDHSSHVRNAAARALRQLEPARSVDLFNRALEEGTDERRKNIGGAIAASGLATEAIENLVSDSREDTYNALSILFVMAKTGEVQPLVQAVEEHQNQEVREAVIKLLNLSNHSELAEQAVGRRQMAVGG